MIVHPEISPLEARIAHLKARLSHYDDSHTLVTNTLTVGDVRRTLDFALSVVSAVPRETEIQDHGAGLIGQPVGSVSVSAQRSEWRPIETAPKDGTRVLVQAPQSGISIGCFDVTRGHWKRDNVGWFGAVPPYHQASGYDDGPTHWMPLPPAPVDELSHHSVSPSRSAAQKITHQSAHSPAIEQAKQELLHAIAHISGLSWQVCLIEVGEELNALIDSSASRLQEVETQANAPTWTAEYLADKERERELCELLRRPQYVGGFDLDEPNGKMVAAADRIERLRRDFETEREMHNAWRKRAEEAELRLQEVEAELKAQVELRNSYLVRANEVGRQQGRQEVEAERDEKIERHMDAFFRIETLVKADACHIYEEVRQIIFALSNPAGSATQVGGNASASPDRSADTPPQEQP